MNSSEQEITTVTAKLLYELVRFNFFPHLHLILTKCLLAYWPRSSSWTLPGSDGSRHFSTNKYLFASPSSPTDLLFKRSSWGFFLKPLRNILQKLQVAFELQSLQCQTHKKRYPVHYFARQHLIVSAKRISWSSLPEKLIFIQLTIPIHCFPGCPPCECDLHSLFPDLWSCLCQGVSWLLPPRGREQTRWLRRSLFVS